MKRKEVPYPEVDDDEVLVRGILHPLFCSSKNKLKREAFLPPPDKNDVSLLRHQYTNDDFCKAHAKSLTIPHNTYKGLAVFKSRHVSEASEAYNNGLTANVEGTPIDEHNNYITSRVVYVEDNGLPMHADMLFTEPLIKGEPNTRHREIANQLLKVAIFFPDPEVQAISWNGEKLHWKELNVKTA